MAIDKSSILRIKPSPLFLVLAPSIVILVALGILMFPTLKKMILAILHSPSLP